jgi:uncharacterized protein YdaT
MKKKMAKFTANLYAGISRRIYDLIGENGASVEKANAMLKTAHAPKSIIPVMTELGLIKQDGNDYVKTGDLNAKEVTTKVYNKYRSMEPAVGRSRKTTAQKTTAQKTTVKSSTKKATKKKAAPKKAAKKGGVKKAKKKAAHGPTYPNKQAPKKIGISRGNTQNNYAIAIAKMRTFLKFPKKITTVELGKKFGISSNVTHGLLSMHVLNRPNGQAGKLVWNGSKESDNHLAIKVMNWITKNVYERNRKNKQSSSPKAAPKKAAVKKPTRVKTSNNQQEELAMEWQKRGRFDLALDVLNK